MADSPEKLYALASVLMVIPLAAVPLRFHVRRVNNTQLGWDDWLILPALLFTILTAICIIIGAALGDLSRHTLIVDGQPVVTERTTVFEKASYYILLTQVLTFGLTKISVLCLYKRIFRGKAFDIVVWIAIVIVILWTVSFFFVNLLQCVPVWIRWEGLGFSSQNCIDENAMQLGQAWSDVFTDVGILCIPMPWLWNLKLPIRKKVAVSSIFLLGTLVVLAGIAKLVAVYAATSKFNQGDLDLTYALAPTQYWPLVESSLGILGACLPVYGPLFKKIFAPIKASIRSGMHMRSTGREQPHKPGHPYQHVDATSQASNAKMIRNSVSAGGMSQKFGIESSATAEHMPLAKTFHKHEDMPEGVIMVDHHFRSYSIAAPADR